MEPDGRGWRGVAVGDEAEGQEKGEDVVGLKSKKEGGLDAGSGCMSRSALIVGPDWRVRRRAARRCTAIIARASAVGERETRGVQGACEKETSCGLSGTEDGVEAPRMQPVVLLHLVHVLRFGVGDGGQVETLVLREQTCRPYSGHPPCQ